MRKSRLVHFVLAVAMGLTSRFAWADLYSAQQAYAKQEYEHAFQLFHELAELGRLEAQEFVAAMYVEGTGVKRDNVLGYAWATIAVENGSTGVQPIVDQLAPHVTPAARKRIDEVRAQFGRAALEQSLIPEFPETRSPLPPQDSAGCTFARPANPDDFYPKEAIAAGKSGNAFVEFTIHPDGRARNPRSWYSVPPGVFDEAAKRVVLASTFHPKKVNGVATTCTLRIAVKFKVRYGGDSGYSEETKRNFAEVRDKARGHDPLAELTYGLLIANMHELNTESERATTWFLKAAQAGIPQAQYLLAKYAFGGHGADVDEHKSLVWLEKSAAGGHASAQVALANRLLVPSAQPADIARGYDLLERAVASGDREGTFFLAALLAASPDAARRDPARALTLLGKVMSDFDADPTAFEIRAAAHAANGDAAAAVNDEELALKRARRLGWDTAPLQARLDTYRRGATWAGSLFTY